MLQPKSFSHSALVLDQPFFNTTVASQSPQPEKWETRKSWSIGVPRTWPKSIKKLHLIQRTTSTSHTSPPISPRHGTIEQRDPEKSNRWTPRAVRGMGPMTCPIPPHLSWQVGARGLGSIFEGGTWLHPARPKNGIGTSSTQDRASQTSILRSSNQRAADKELCEVVERRSWLNLSHPNKSAFCGNSYSNQLRA